ncbi:MAG: chromosome segregation protein SMC [Rhodospirillales bacterium]|nr:chromosome segregation protein SMC [Rhodospirillales bacterium]
MLQFTKVRLSGFKSFVEPSDVLIERGTTGIVGPNGCGKSNLVEAIRWAMGETSAKKVRGGEMDDVIFGGSGSRPARNIAEVILSLDNQARSAPAAFNDSGEIEVSRRIERGQGSTFRVNGREVRARDVQLLFADSATGARSTALVSQGRVGEVIAAKPVGRRALLEEAAGIVGLHSRRHEAELRLRGAETNLERLDDVLASLELQLRGLKKQVRQAKRYRTINDHIRRAEAALFLSRWRAATASLADSQLDLERVSAEVATLTGRTAAAATALADADAAVPAHRDAEVRAAAVLQRLSVERDGLALEEQRVSAAEADLRDRLQQAAADMDRERALAIEAGEAAKRLGVELAEIVAASKREAEARNTAASQLEAANAMAAEAEAVVTALTEEAAAAGAHQAGIEGRIAQFDERRRRLAVRLDEITRELDAHDSGTDDRSPLEGAARTLDEARRQLSLARDATAVAEKARVDAASATARTADDRQAAAQTLATLEAEARALADVLSSGEADLWPPVYEAVRVADGYEAALGAALGDDLSAPSDEPAPVHWRTLPPTSDAPALPAGADAVSRHVKAPAALRRRLDQIGVVEDADAAERLRDHLAQGQRLVSRDGGLWRWDGFTVAAGAASPAATRIAQRKRLNAVRLETADAIGALETKDEHMQAARAAEARAADEERSARESGRAAEAAWEAFAEIKESVAEAASRRAALGEGAEQARTEIAEIEPEIERLRQSLADLPATDDARTRLTALRDDLSQRRSAEADCRAVHDGLVREVENRSRRENAIGQELALWQGRKDGAEAHLNDLEDRRRQAAGEIDRLAERPREIAERRRLLLSSLEQAEGYRRGAADRLAEAEGRLAEAGRAARGAEAERAGARERMVRAEGLAEQGEQAIASLTERIAERVQCAPEELATHAGLGEDAETPDEETLQRRLERLLRERDNMGPVNLRAEHEVEEVEERFTSLGSEREDLVHAIAKLRRGIGELDREGRERLLASFNEVDHHFQELFKGLFGGGRAHLQLTESEDPLEAGLEIMASPPGKRLQVLSLLSGGEQALTAIALLFAVFLTNPAPICILDEVDAPLDDANVGRVLNLVDQIANQCDTRFLIVSHNRMTMAQVDRLFGVTMGEQGVSQLVSVDLGQAEALHQTA